MGMVRRGIRSVAIACRVGTVGFLSPTMRLYRTDKYVHGYARYYERHLRYRRWRRLGVLEIGIGGYETEKGGGSLRVWRDFFPRSRIVGIDIHDKHLSLGPRVVAVKGHQASRPDLERALGSLPHLDVVIDDGSHRGDDIVATFNILFDAIRPGGIYVIEDMHTSYWEQFGGADPAPDATSVGLAKRLVDEVQALDEVYERKPQWGARPDTGAAKSAAIHVYPGIVFIEKAPRHLA